MKVTQSVIPGVLILEPRVFEDERGFFLESYNKRTFREAIGKDVEFVQDNYSRSAKSVLRGLHYQTRHAQGKLVSVIEGEVYDVAVDLRKGSLTFGNWTGFTLSAADKRKVWIPAGFAHGFVVLSEHAELHYKATDYYAPQFEKTILWNDPDIGIRWPMTGAPVLSKKDSRGDLLRNAEIYAADPVAWGCPAHG